MGGRKDEGEGRREEERGARGRWDEGGGIKVEEEGVSLFFCLLVLLEGLTVLIEACWSRELERLCLKERLGGEREEGREMGGSKVGGEFDFCSKKQNGVLDSFSGVRFELNSVISFSKLMFSSKVGLGVDS